MAASLASERQQGPTAPPKRRKRYKNLRHDFPIHLILLTGLFFSLVPALFMIMISFKSQGEFLTNPLGFPAELKFENYQIAFNVIQRSLLNSGFLVVINVIGSLSLSTLAAYVFARFTFPGRNLLFWLITAILFIPPILTFAPRFVVVTQLNLIDTYWSLILPLIAGSQAFEIFVLRSFFIGIPNEIVDSARVDGANVMTVFLRIILPMSRPILATLAVLRVVDVWNEWLWPLVTIKSFELRPMAMQVFYLSSDMGAHVPRQMAGYALATIPLLILFVFLSKQFVEGLTSGALKW